MDKLLMIFCLALAACKTHPAPAPAPVPVIIAEPMVGVERPAPHKAKPPSSVDAQLLEAQTALRHARDRNIHSGDK